MQKSIYNSQQRYANFISSRPKRNKSVHTHNHHILPLSLGGNNNKDNLIFLTHKEHFIAHIMLVKCFKGKDKAKMIFALNGMKNKNRNHFKITSRTYHIIKRLHQQIASARSKKYWADPIWRAKTLETWKAKRNKNMSESKKKQWADPAFKNKVKKSFKKMWTNPKYRALKMSQRDLKTGKYLKASVCH